ncbi:hypothetical protein V6N11_022887 [Hibiscus sabdariffa]|uniref:Uncharacterized protein n=1 Tax=Hibiscus sabdariffa TaxID=183260 RepID=A0ABR2TKS0_9ROSI
MQPPPPVSTSSLVKTGLAAFIATGKSTQVRQGKRLLGLRKWQQEVNCPLSKSKFLITQLKIDDGHRLGEAKETIRILGNNVLGLDWLPEPVSEPLKFKVGDTGKQKRSGSGREILSYITPGNPRLKKGIKIASNGSRTPGKSSAIVVDFGHKTIMPQTPHNICQAYITTSAVTA